MTEKEKFYRESLKGKYGFIFKNDFDSYWPLFAKTKKGLIGQILAVFDKDSELLKNDNHGLHMPDGEIKLFKNAYEMILFLKK